MLRALALRDFVIVDSLELELATGFTALTGETGAGKSILVDALGLILGERADPGVIRRGADRADLTAEFDVSGLEAARRWLAANDLEEGEGESCLVRRAIDRSGRSRGFVNGRPATATQLRELGEHLVDIHGQHEHQWLAQRDYQRRLLDAFAAAEEDAHEVARRHGHWRRSARGPCGARARAGLVRAGARIPGRARSAISRRSRSRRSPGPRRRRSIAVSPTPRNSSPIAGPRWRQRTRPSTVPRASSRSRSRTWPRPPKSTRRWREARRALESAAAHAAEAAHELRRYLSRVEPDPARLDALERRLGAVHDAARRTARRSRGNPGCAFGAPCPARGTRRRRKPRGPARSRGGREARVFRCGPHAVREAPRRRAPIWRGSHAAPAGTRHGRRAPGSSSRAAGRTGLPRPGGRRIPRGGAYRPADGAHREGGIGRRALAPRAGDPGAHGRARRHSHARVRRSGRGHRRAGRRDRRIAARRAFPPPPGSLRHAPAASGLARPPPAARGQGGSLARQPSRPSKRWTPPAGWRKLRACWEGRASRRRRGGMRKKCSATRRRPPRPRRTRRPGRQGGFASATRPSTEEQAWKWQREQREGRGWCSRAEGPGPPTRWASCRPSRKCSRIPPSIPSRSSRARRRARSTRARWPATRTISERPSTACSTCGATSSPTTSTARISPASRPTAPDGSPGSSSAPS